MNIPEGLLYSKEHEWVRFDGDKAYVGVTDYAQEHLGDIVFVELPEIGTSVEPMGEVSVVESVKAVSSVFSPIGGTVVEVNEKLLDAPELINESPYDNFIFVLETDGKGKDALLDAASYQPLCSE